MPAHSPQVDIVLRPASGPGLLFVLVASKNIKAMTELVTSYKGQTAQYNIVKEFNKEFIKKPREEVEGAAARSKRDKGASGQRQRRSVQRARRQTRSVKGLGARVATS